MAQPLDAKAEADKDAASLHSLGHDQSVASVVQKQVHDARTEFTNPSDYNKFLSAYESNFSNQGKDSTVDAIRFYGTLELHDPTDLRNAQNGDTGATGASSWLGGISTNLGLSASEKTQALDHLGFQGDGALGNFNNIYGASVGKDGRIVIDSTKTNEDMVTMPSDNGAVNLYSDGSSRGFHYATGADGKPTLGPDGKPVVDAVNETDADGYSRKLVLQPDGTWASGKLSTQFGVAEAPDDHGQPVDFKPDAVSSNGVHSLQDASASDALPAGTPGQAGGDVGTAGTPGQPAPDAGLSGAPGQGAPGAPAGGDTTAGILSQIPADPSDPYYQILTRLLQPNGAAGAPSDGTGGSPADGPVNPSLTAGSPADAPAVPSLTGGSPTDGTAVPGMTGGSPTDGTAVPGMTGAPVAAQPSFSS